VKRHRRTLKRRYGHTGGTLKSVYTHRQSPTNARKEIVSREGREVGVVTWIDTRRWRWHTLYRSYGGYTRTMRGGVKKVIEAVEKSIARSL
jgi:hypothetical protein